MRAIITCGAGFGGRGDSGWRATVDTTLHDIPIRATIGCSRMVGKGFPEENRGGCAQLREIVLLDSVSKTMDFLPKFERGVR